MEMGNRPSKDDVFSSSTMDDISSSTPPSAPSIDLHQRLYSLLPLNLKSCGKVIAAILRPELDPTDEFGWSDVEFLRCDYEDDLATLGRQYHQLHPEGDQIILKHDFGIVDGETKVKELAKRSRTFVALQAICMYSHTDGTSTGKASSKEHTE